MPNKPIGKVTPEERDDIRALHVRKTGLGELFATMAKADQQSLSTGPLYEKLIADMGEASVKFQRWWDAMSEKYNWERAPGKKWRIDFETGDIYLDG